MGSWKGYAAAAALNAGLVLLVLLARGTGLRVRYVDAFSVAGAVSVLLGLLGWVADAGAFDTIGYGFSFFRAERRYRDLYDYTLQKREKRDRQGKGFVPFLLVGALFLAVSFLISVV